MRFSPLWIPRPSALLCHLWPYFVCFRLRCCDCCYRCYLCYRYPIFWLTWKHAAATADQRCAATYPRCRARRNTYCGRRRRGRWRQGCPIPPGPRWWHRRPLRWKGQFILSCPTHCGHIQAEDRRSSSDLCRPTKSIYTPYQYNTRNRTSITQENHVLESRFSRN